MYKLGKRFRTCRKCRSQKEQAEYSLTKSGRYSPICNPCKLLPRKELVYRRRKHEEFGLTEVEYSNLKIRLHNYGMQPTQFFSLFNLQEGRCAICKIEGGYSMHIDHCHITQKVRGILCSRCNMGLGFFGDSSQLLLNAVKYLDPKKPLKA